MRLRKGDTGRWARTNWDCTGARDGIIVDVDRENRWASVYFPHSTHGIEVVDFSQISKLGEHVRAKESGL